MKTTKSYDFHADFHARNCKGQPRLKQSYRGARRNRVIRILKMDWRGVEPDRVVIHPPVRENKRDRTAELKEAAE